MAIIFFGLMLFPICLVSFSQNQLFVCLSQQNKEANPLGEIELRKGKKRLPKI
jgi:hypothetical protein